VIVFDIETGPVTETELKRLMPPFDEAAVKTGNYGEEAAAKKIAKAERPPRPEIKIRDRDPKLVIAEVGGEPIASGIYDRLVGMRMVRQTRFKDGKWVPPDATQEARIKQEAVDFLVKEKRWALAAKKAGLKATDEDAQRQVDSFLKRYKTPAEKDKWLADHKLNEAEMKADYMRKSLADQMRRQVMESVKIPEAELKAAFDKEPDKYAQVEARHVLVKFDPKADEATRKAAKDKILAARKRIAGGEDFAKVAGEVSECPSGKRSGGSLGYFTRGRMVPPFEQAAFSLEPGKLSDVVETRFGYHIIRVEGKKTAFADAKKTIERKLVRPKQREALMAKEQELETTYPAKVNQDLL